MEAQEYWPASPIRWCSHFVLCYCIDLWLFVWGNLFFHQPRLAASEWGYSWLSSYWDFFFFKLRKGVWFNCYFSIIPMQLLDLWYWLSFSDRTAHLMCSWRGCCEAHCVLVLTNFTPLLGGTAGIQESRIWSQRCYSCLLFPWEDQGRFYPKTKSNVSNNGRQICHR